MARGIKFSRPITVTGAPATNNELLAHRRAILCCIRPSSSKQEGASEMHPKKPAKKKNKGPRTSLELRLPANERGGGVPSVVLIPPAAPPAQAGKLLSTDAPAHPGKVSR